MADRDVVVIGGSAGGIKAMRGILAGLPASIPAAIFLVLHTSPNSPGLLPDLLKTPGAPKVRYAGNGDRFERGVVYIAPADYHMLVEADGRIVLAFGPKENRFRPAVDPLFRSAALAFGPRVAGVLLSGGLDDGTAGLAAVKAAGGVSIVQDPEQAEVPSMPQSALRQVVIDHCLPVRDIAALLPRLAVGEESFVPAQRRGDAEPGQDLALEVGIAKENRGHISEVAMLGTPSMFTCPECHSTLMRLNENQLLRFRCHTGHAYTARSLLASLTERTEDALWNSVRALEESAMLLGHMADHVSALEGPALTDEFRRTSEEELRRAHAVRSIIAEAQTEARELAKKVS